MGEFDLIRRFFQRPVAPGAAPGVALGIGDDAALLTPAPGMHLAISSDMLVQGRHFFADVDPAALGHKALAVNLSDMAATGARPLAFTLALALPRADKAWLAAFSAGLFALADAHGCPLVGGDTTQGPLNLCITILGEVPAGQALTRAGARPGDDLWVSGSLGDARLALLALQGQLALPPAALAVARQRLERPTPRVALGLALRGIATSAIDLSDGLAGDVGHLLHASRVGAVLYAQNAIDLVAAWAEPMGLKPLFDDEARLRHVLAGGDDYELLFTAPTAARAAVQAAARASATPVTRIGHIDASPGLRLRNAQGQEGPLPPVASFDHFRA
ncbi:MAG: thiamine-phosphate kinase [Comamonadaceae bacterium]|nr:thiamine-phosphate kinase [Comamonadaceae bacterium]